MNEELLQEETKVAEDTVAEAAAQTEPQTMADLEEHFDDALSLIHI